MKYFLFLIVINLSVLPAVLKAENPEQLPPESQELPVVSIYESSIEVPEGKELVLSVYTVKPGDTLAGLAEEKYGNKELWKIIYGYNKFVKNSHWIFPGDRLIVPEIVEKIVVEKPKVKKAVKEKKYRQYGDFVAPEDFEFFGAISGFRKPKNLHHQGDVVFIDRGKNSGIVPGSRLGIYRTTGYVSQPYTGEFLGNIVEKVGEILVGNDIEESVATAQISYSQRSIELGDQLLLLK